MCDTFGLESCKAMIKLKQNWDYCYCGESDFMIVASDSKNVSIEDSNFQKNFWFVIEFENNSKTKRINFRAQRFIRKKYLAVVSVSYKTHLSININKDQIHVLCTSNGSSFFAWCLRSFSCAGKNLFINLENLHLSNALPTSQTRYTRWIHSRASLKMKKKTFSIAFSAWCALQVKVIRLLAFFRLDSFIRNSFKGSQHKFSELACQKLLFDAIFKFMKIFEEFFWLMFLMKPNQRKEKKSKNDSTLGRHHHGGNNWSRVILKNFFEASKIETREKHFLCRLTL